jgi:transposase
LKALEEYADKVAQIAAEDMVFVDEAGVNLGMVRQYGWAPEGERLVFPSPVCRGQNITIIGALDCHGMLTEMLVEGGVDKETFRVFIKKCLVPELLPGQVVIMDNLQVHKDSEVERMIRRAGASLLFLPPYHPELDPIENCWSKFKNILRAIAARTRDALTAAAKHAALAITSKDALGWFSHCGYSEPCNTAT